MGISGSHSKTVREECHSDIQAFIVSGFDIINFRYGTDVSYISSTIARSFTYIVYIGFYYFFLKDIYIEYPRID